MKDQETTDLVTQLETQLAVANSLLEKLHLNDTVVQISSARTAEGPVVLDLISCIQYHEYYKNKD